MRPEQHNLIFTCIFQLRELRITVEGLEKERDFYFGKLRDIEIICQEDEGSSSNKRIMEILYATEVSTWPKPIDFRNSAFRHVRYLF